MLFRSTWVKSATAGTVSISSSGLITVTGLTSGQSATVTVTTTRTGYDNGSSQVSGSAIADSDGDGINDDNDAIPYSEPALPVPTLPALLLGLMSLLMGLLGYRRIAR